MHNRRLPRLLMAAALGVIPILSAALSFAQAPPPVPALPDAERRTQYAISGSTCACAVNFALFGSGSDVDSWLEVWISGVRYLSTDPLHGWVLTSVTGPLATISRPITDAVLVFNLVQAGAVQIVGAERPRRTAQFAENRGVAARDLNQAITDLVAVERELWDKTNDVTGRAVLAPPGETIKVLPPAASRLSQGACFDSGGNLVNCVSIPASTFSSGSGITFTGTNPTSISTATFTAGTGVTFTGTNPTTISAAAPTASAPQMRLTLASGVPVTTADQSGIAAHFCTPYPGGSASATAFVPITADGVNFTMTSAGEMTQATTDATKSPAAVANNSVYDIFLWSDSGTIRCTRGPPWSSDTSRGAGAGTTEIDFTTKLPTNKNAITNGPGANRGVLLGSVRSNGSAAFMDTALFRWTSNVYNAQARLLLLNIATASWTYASAAWRQSNASAANQVDILQSLSGGMVHVDGTQNQSNSGTSSYSVCAIGFDAASGPGTGAQFSAYQITASSVVYIAKCSLDNFPGIGRHFYPSLEYAITGTQTYTGAATLIQSGLAGWVFN